MKLLSTTIAIALIATSAAAQNPPALDLDTVHTAWAPNGGSFGRAVAGDFTGDRLPDVALIDGSLAYVIDAPRYFATPTSANLLANDLDRLPGAPDSLVVVGLEGLHRVDWSNGSLVATPIDTSAWIDARLVRCADVDGDGVPEIVGVLADRRTVKVLQGEGVDYTPLWTFTAVADVLALATLDWDASKVGDEVAVASECGLEVFARADGRVHLELRASDTAVLERVRGGDEDCLAWVTDGNSEQVLVVAGRAATQTDVSLGSQTQVVSLGAGDIELDGDDDLVLGHTYNHFLPILVNRTLGPIAPDGHAFSVYDPNALLLPLLPNSAPANPGNRARPVLADFDLDGDVDVFCAVESTRDLYVYQSDGVSECGRALSVTGAARTSNASSSSYTFQLALDKPSDDILLPLATHVEVSLWRKAVLGYPVDPARVDHRFVALDDLGDGPGLVLDFTLAEPPLEYGAIYYLQLRMVSYEPVQDRLLWSGPSWMGVATGRASTFAVMQAQSGASCGSLFAFEIDDGEIRNAGGVIPRPPLPIFGNPPH